MDQCNTSGIAHRLTCWPIVASVLLLAACDGSTSPNSNASLRIASPAQAGLSSETVGGLSISGSNGTLVLTDMKLIVDEFEIENDDDDCDDDDVVGVCAEFETELFIADVPLGSGALNIANDRIPAGTYTKLEFEVESLDDDEGTFTPTGGQAREFRAYFDAEVEIERYFATPLVIDGNSAGITLELRPDLWFRNADGTVRDLSQWNFATTSRLIEFEVEFERGVRVEFED